MYTSIVIRKIERASCHSVLPVPVLEKLEEKKQEEMESKFFTEMPNQHYMEITQISLNW